MGNSRFSNQTPDEIIKHLAHMLDPDTTYNLSADPLRVHFTVVESTRPARRMSEKRRMIREQQTGKSRRWKKHMATKKTTRPKIRSVKKGRTVQLKGIVY